MPDIVDAWMQHPTARFMAHEMLASLRRWANLPIPADDPPIEDTIAAMDAGGVGLGLISAWQDASGPMMSNDLVASFVAAHPDRLAGIAAVNLLDPMRGSETGRPIPYLDEVALDFPELRIVGGHIGYPWTLEMISLCRKYPNVYLDTSAYTIKRYPPELVDYLRTDGRHKVLFGTNHPMITAGRTLRDLPGLDLDEEAGGLFLAGNARRVFRLKES